jgi:purine nucleosidase
VQFLDIKRTETMPTPVIIDCDPGIDDAVSLAMAVASPELQIIGVTTTYGNVGVENTTDNALRVLDWLGHEAPVFRGADRALLGQPVDAAAYHGATGLEAPALGRSRRSAETSGAIQFLIDSLLRRPEKLPWSPLGR